MFARKQTANRWLRAADRKTAVRTTRRRSGARRGGRVSTSDRDFPQADPSPLRPPRRPAPRMRMTCWTAAVISGETFMGACIRLRRFHSCCDICSRPYAMEDAPTPTRTMSQIVPTVIANQSDISNLHFSHTTHLGDRRAALRTRILRRPQIIPALAAKAGLRGSVAMPKNGGGDGG